MKNRKILNRRCVFPESYVHDVVQNKNGDAVLCPCRSRLLLAMSVSPLLEIPAIDGLELDATAEPTDTLGPKPLVPSGLDWLCPSPPLPSALQATKGNREHEQAGSRIGQPEDDQAGHEYSETSSWTDEPLGVGRGSRLGHRRRRRLSLIHI